MPKKKKDNQNKKKSGKEKNKLLMIAIYALAIIAIVVLAYLAYKFTHKAPDFGPNVTNVVVRNGEVVAYRYNGFDFENKDGIWYTQVQNGGVPYIIAFSYGPLDVRNISIDYKPNDFQMLTKPGSKAYLTFDHNSSDAAYIATASINLVANLKTVWGVNITRACSSNNTDCFDAPVVTCASHPGNMVIQFVDSEEPGAVYEDNCLTIKGSKEEYMRVTEKIILDWYNII